MDKVSIKQKLGKSIAKARIAQDMTQEVVAEKLGIGNEAMSRIERGIVEPSITRIFELAEILNCDVQTEPTRVFRRQFILSHATLADSSNRR